MTPQWDERLISQDRAISLSGSWPLTVEYAGPDSAYLRCVTCSGNVTLMPSAGKSISVDGIIAAVLGHMVRCHHYTLSGGAQNGDPAGAS